MSDLAEVRKTLEEAIQMAQIGIEECEKKLAEVEKIRIQLSLYHNDIHKLQAALRALDGKVGLSDPIKMTVKTSKAFDPSQFSKGSSLPPTGNDFFAALVGNEPLRSSQVYALAVARLGIDPDKKQAAALKQRVSVYLSALTNKGHPDLGRRTAEYLMAKSSSKWEMTPPGVEAC